MQNKHIDIIFVGDIMQHEKQLELEATRNYSYKGVFDKIQHLLPVDAFIVGNLETTIGDDKNTGFPNFSAPPEFLQALKAAGFNALITCNNHSLDKDETSLLQTETRIQQLGMLPIGTRVDKAMFTSQFNNIRINVQAATCIMNEDRTSKFVQFYDVNKFNVDETATVNIAYIHCGEEYNNSATREQKMIRRELLAKGWQAVIFVHSHVIGSNESYSLKRQFVQYGLGNFISDQKMLDRQIGRILKFRITENGISRITTNDVETVWNDDKSAYYVQPYVE